MEITWFLVANRIEARVYKILRPQSLLLIRTFENPVARERKRSFQTDQPGFGRAPFGGSASTHRVGGESDPHEDAAKVFARELAGELDLARGKNQFQQLVLVAEPHFHGMLYKSLSEPTRKKVVARVLKDYIKLPERELEEILIESTEGSLGHKASGQD